MQKYSFFLIIFLFLSQSLFGADYNIVEESIALGSSIDLADTTDDTAAINAVINSLSSGDTLYFPTGTYNVSGTININVTNVIFYGDGPNATVIQSDSSSTVIDWDIPTPLTNSLRMKDITLLASASGGNGIAILMDYAGSPSSSSGTPKIVLERVHIRSGEASYFTTGIEVKDGWNTEFIDCYITGRDHHTGKGVHFSTRVKDFIIRGCQINFFERGIDIERDSGGSSIHEAIIIDNCALVDHRYPLYAHSISGGIGRNLYLINSHVDARGSSPIGVYTQNWHDVTIEGNMLFCGVASTGSALLLKGQSMNTSLITNNACRSFEILTTGGFVLSPTSIGTEISYNTLSWLHNDNAIALQSGTFVNVVKENVITPTAENGIVDQGYMNYVSDNSDF